MQEVFQRVREHVISAIVCPAFDCGFHMPLACMVSVDQGQIVDQVQIASISVARFWACQQCQAASLRVYKAYRKAALTAIMIAIAPSSLHQRHLNPRTPSWDGGG